MPTGLNPEEIKCENCGAALFSFGKRPRIIRNNDSQKSPFRVPKLVISDRVKTVAILVGILTILTLFVADEIRKGPASPFTQSVSSLTQSAALPPLVTQSSGVMWNKTRRHPTAPLQIKTRAGPDYYIKFIDKNTNLDAVAIYVAGGKSLEVLVPPGSYIMRYAYGKSWRGEEHFFGPGGLTNFAEAKKVFYFSISNRGTSGWTVELVPQYGGNLPTRSIRRDQF